MAATGERRPGGPGDDLQEKGRRGCSPALLQGAGDYMGEDHARHSQARFPDESRFRLAEVLGRREANKLANTPGTPLQYLVHGHPLRRDMSKVRIRETIEDLRRLTADASGTRGEATARNPVLPFERSENEPRRAKYRGQHDEGSVCQLPSASVPWPCIRVRRSDTGSPGELDPNDLPKWTASRPDHLDALSATARPSRPCVRPRWFCRANYGGGSDRRSASHAGLSSAARWLARSRRRSTNFGRATS
jgi:hypothetical protein